MEGKIKAIGNIQSMLNYSDELTDYCYDQLFYGCNSLTAAPKLPATKLANYCYRSMFAGCSSLTAAPELPATTLAEYCYYSMFINCSNLNYIKVGFTDWDNAEGCTINWVYNVAANGTFECPATLNTSVTGGSGIPFGWTVQHGSSLE